MKAGNVFFLRYFVHKVVFDSRESWIQTEPTQVSQTLRRQIADKELIKAVLCI